MRFSSVAILGPGLLGGSIALALRRVAPATRLALWARRPAAVAELEKTAAGLAQFASTDAAAVVRGAEVVILCVPIGAMAPLAETIAPHLSRDALVTDVGSVKGPVVRALGPIFAGRAPFVGSHPMAGSEQAGLAAARADLFQDAVCIVTPEPLTAPATVAAARAFWELLGCRVRELPPDAHDEAIGLVSHLPHLLAAALVHTAHARNPAALAFCGNGFRDTTRIAAGPPAMWAEILEQNRAALKSSVNAMIENLKDVVKLLDVGDTHAMERFLTEAKTQRDRLPAKTTALSSMHSA